MSNQANWALVISSYAVVSTIFGSALFYIFRHAVKKVLADEMKEMKIPLSQLQNNGGFSVKDTVEKTLKAVEEVKLTVARQEGRLDQHIADGH